MNNFRADHIKIINILLFSLCLGGSVFGDFILYPESEVELRSFSHQMIQIQKPVLLSYDDIIKTGHQGKAILKYSEKSDISFGSDSMAILKEDHSQWPTIKLQKGSVEVQPNGETTMIKSPVGEVVCFNGKTRIFVSGGVTIIIPLKGAGVIVYSEDFVGTVIVNQIGLIDQKGRFSLLSGKSVKTSELKWQSTDYRNWLYESLDAGRKAEMPESMPFLVRELLFSNLSFRNEVHALGSSYEIYDYYYDAAELIEKGRELIFARDLFSSTDDSTLLPKSAEYHLADNENAQKFKTTLKKADKELDTLTQEEKSFVVYFFRQKIVESLTPKYNLKNSFSANFKELISYNSNVTQLADGQTSVAEKDGVSAHSSLLLNYTGKAYFWGQPNVSLKLTDLSYLESSFENREYSNITFKYKNKLRLLKDSFLSSITPVITIKEDYLNSSNGQYHGFTSYSPTVDLLFRPWKNLGKHSDLMMLYTSFGVELKRYAGDDSRRLDLSGKSKDATSPQLLMLLMNSKSYSKYTGKTMLMLNYRDVGSDSPEYDYSLMRFDLSYDFIFGTYVLVPSLAYSEKSHDLYITLPRDDNSYEIGLGLRKKVLDEKANLGIGLRHTQQNSNQSQFEYKNDQVSLNFSYSF